MSLRIDGTGGSPDVVHAVTVKVALDPHPVVLAGAPIGVAVEAACSAGCDLDGATVSLVTETARVGSARLRRSEEGRKTTAMITASAPNEAGRHDWTVRVETAAQQQSSHATESHIFVSVVPHPTSVAVWDTPPAVVAGRLVNVKVGVKCLAGCAMSQRIVVLVNQSAAIVATGTTGPDLWPGTESLYFCELCAVAPDGPGLIQWRAQLVAEHPGPAHEEVSAVFGFRVLPTPDYRITVLVCDAENGYALDDVEVRCGPLVASSDATGRAMFEVTRGEYQVTIRKDGFEAAPETVEAVSDVDVRIAAARCLTREAWERTLQPYKDVPWG